MHREAGREVDGVYTIDPDGAEGNDAFDVYCDMTTDGGGWTLITSINKNTTVTEVDSTALITPHSENVTNRNMQLPGATEVLFVNDGRDAEHESDYDKQEKFSNVAGLSLTWQQIIDALNAKSSQTWRDLLYSRGNDDSWQFTVERVNSEGCLQTALRGSYGDGNYGDLNGALTNAYSPLGGFYIHWGQEIWMAGIYGHKGVTAKDFFYADLRCNTSLRTFQRFWKGAFLR